MFKIYSKSCEYALRALTQIPAEDYQTKFSAQKLCEKADVPESFTRKVFQDLARKDILQAISGPGGGYRLARHPKEISLLEFVYAVDGADCFEACIMGLETCGSESPCPVHYSWVRMKTNITSEMKAKTLEDLMESLQKSQKKKVKARGKK